MTLHTPDWLTASVIWRLFFLGVLYACLRRLNQLLTMGQQDRIAREIALLELKMKTFEIADQVQKRASDLEKKVDSNTATTEDVLKHVTNGGQK